MSLWSGLVVNSSQLVQKAGTASRNPVNTQGQCAAGTTPAAGHKTGIRSSNRKAITRIHAVDRGHDDYGDSKLDDVSPVAVLMRARATNEPEVTIDAIALRSFAFWLATIFALVSTASPCGLHIVSIQSPQKLHTISG